MNYILMCMLGFALFVVGWWFMWAICVAASRIDEVRMERE